MKLALIPQGEFIMGSSIDVQQPKHDEQIHRVRITRPFFIGVCEVTLGEFEAFYEAAGYETRWQQQGTPGAIGLVPKNGKVTGDTSSQYTPWSWGHPSQTKNHPVVEVSWKDAAAFCEWLSRKEERRYRLPTEAEWEYACRAGTTTQFSNGDDFDGLVEVANVADKANYDAEILNSGRPVFYAIHANDGFPFSAPVGQFRPNNFGLFDMHGNVAEWCSDWYDKRYYLNSPLQDPPGPQNGTARITRGGAWGSMPRQCRSGYRRGRYPETRTCDIGFRVVCER